MVSFSKQYEHGSWYDVKADESVLNIEDINPESIFYDRFNEDKADNKYEGTWEMGCHIEKQSQESERKYI